MHPCVQEMFCIDRCRMFIQIFSYNLNVKFRTYSNNNEKCIHIKNILQNTYLLELRSFPNPTLILVEVMMIFFSWLDLSSNKCHKEKISFEKLISHDSHTFDLFKK